MHFRTEYDIGRQRREDIRQEVAVGRLEKLARANREISPYVVRDLSWELARYLDTEIFSANPSATPVEQHEGVARAETRGSGR